MEKFLRTAKPDLVTIAIGLLLLIAVCLNKAVSTVPTSAMQPSQPQTIVETQIPEIKNNEPKIEIINLGIFKCTAYCGENYPHICNDGDASNTATGAKPEAGRTISVDPRLIPYGTKVIIDGRTYIAEDCGGSIKDKRVDIFFNTHQEALNFGIQYKEIYIERTIENEQAEKSTNQIYSINYCCSD